MHAIIGLANPRRGDVVAELAKMARNHAAAERREDLKDMVHELVKVTIRNA